MLMVIQLKDRYSFFISPIVIRDYNTRFDPSEKKCIHNNMHNYSFKGTVIFIECATDKQVSQVHVLGTYREPNSD